MTYTSHGAKQVGLIGNDEKRVFTVLLAVSAASDELPPQCIYGGKSKGSHLTDNAASRRTSYSDYMHSVAVIESYTTIYRIGHSDYIHSHLITHNQPFRLH
jgi:5-keto 4-deoxyuronate isomerase